MVNEIERLLDDEYSVALQVLSTIKCKSDDKYEEQLEYVKEISKLRIEEKKMSIEQDKVNADIEMAGEKLKIEEKRMSIEQDKANADIEMAGEKLKHDIIYANTKFDEDKKLKRIELVIGLCSVVFPLAVYAKFVDKGFELEKEGTYTSVTLKNLLQKFRSTR